MTEWVVDEALPLTALERSFVLVGGQGRTLLLGVALQVLEQQARGQLVGPLHPWRVVVDATGRPAVAVARVPPGWSAHDDVVAVRRLARRLGVDICLVGDLREIVVDLAAGGGAAALPPVRTRGRARSARRRRWWRRGTRTRPPATGEG